MKQILIRKVSDEVHKQFKMHCLQADYTQQKMLMLLIKAEIKDCIIANASNRTTRQ